MEIFKKINFKQFFTLIELIVVIVVLGVLAAIVIPNISSFKEEAQETAIKADARNIQTAVDIFMLDYHGTTPTKEKASLGNPQIVELYGLKPNYLRDLPKDNSAKFWLDENNTVWASKVDAPTNVSYDNENQILSWDTVDGATLYKIYKSGTETSTAANASKLSHLKNIEVQLGDKQDAKLEPLEQGFYLVSALDLFESESAPTGENTKYEGYGEGPDKEYIKEETNVSKNPLTSLTFTNAGATGRFGPLQSDLDSHYSDTPLNGKVTSLSGIQLWTVPTTGTYSIETYGAQGGDSVFGGKGAKAQGDFLLSEGQKVFVLVGQKGDHDNGSGNWHSGTGGGGSFVAIGTTINNSTPLVVAGGGGGRHYNNSTGGDGGIQVVSAGTGFGGKATTSSTNGGSSGAGFHGNGKTLEGRADYKPQALPQAFIYGGTGALGRLALQTHGGFGGGGVAGGNHGAGGGGYIGGDYGVKGMGGTSFNSGINQSNTSGSNSGHGKVIITLID